LLDLIKKEQGRVTEEELRSIATESGTKDIINHPSTFTRPGPSMREYIMMFSQVWRDSGIVVSQEERDITVKERQEQRLQETSKRLAYETLDTLDRRQQKIIEDELLSLAAEVGVAAHIPQNPSLYGDPEDAMKKHVGIFNQILRDGNVVVSLVVRDAIVKAQEQKHRDSKLNMVVSDFALITQAKTLAMLYVVGAAIATGDYPATPEQYQLTQEDQTKQRQYAEAYITAYTNYRVPKPSEPPTPRKKFLGII
jgi:hypothetical protein